MTWEHIVREFSDLVKFEMVPVQTSSDFWSKFQPSHT